MDQVISLPSLLDFVTTAGPKRIAIVRRAKEADPVKLQADDFYAQVSGALRDMHIHGSSPKMLDVFLHAQRDERRRRIYPSVIEGYRKFLRDQGPKVTWWAPPASTVRYGDLHVHVAPELGLGLGEANVPHLIALDFVVTPISAKRRLIHLNVLWKAFGTTVPGATFAMLNVRRANLYKMGPPNKRIDVLLTAEARAFESIWRAL